MDTNDLSQRQCSVKNILSRYVLIRENNKEGKRVSNALYTPYKMFSESHAPGIQKLTNESAGFKWHIVGMTSSAS